MVRRRFHFDADFDFAFNDNNFSDEVLRIKIMLDPIDSRPNLVDCTTIVNRARHREDVKRRTSVDIALMPNKKILNGNQPDLDECEYQDEDVVAMVEEPNSSDEATNDVDSDWSMDYPRRCNFQSLTRCCKAISGWSVQGYNQVLGRGFGLAPSLSRGNTMKVMIFRFP
ncbi:hypothetical protein ACSQ67_017239 [Phaseolus vulgaris]